MSPLVPSACCFDPLKCPKSFWYLLALAFGYCCLCFWTQVEWLVTKWLDVVFVCADPPRDTEGVEVSHYLLQLDSDSGVLFALLHTLCVYCLLLVKQPFYKVTSSCVNGCKSRRAVNKIKYFSRVYCLLYWVSCSNLMPFGWMLFLNGFLWKLLYKSQRFTLGDPAATFYCCS